MPTFTSGKPVKTDTHYSFSNTRNPLAYPACLNFCNKLKKITFQAKIFRFRIEIFNAFPMSGCSVQRSTLNNWTYCQMLDIFQRIFFLIKQEYFALWKISDYEKRYSNLCKCIKLCWSSLARFRATKRSKLILIFCPDTFYRSHREIYHLQRI